MGFEGNLMAMQTVQEYEGRASISFHLHHHPPSGPELSTSTTGELAGIDLGMFNPFTVLSQFVCLFIGRLSNLGTAYATPKSCRVLSSVIFGPFLEIF